MKKVTDNLTSIILLLRVEFIYVSIKNINITFQHYHKDNLPYIYIISINLFLFQLFFLSLFIKNGPKIFKTMCNKERQLVNRIFHSKIFAIIRHFFIFQFHLISLLHLTNQRILYIFSDFCGIWYNSSP